MPKTAQERGHRGLVSRTGTAYIRTRTASACQVCRARRQKCDNERPCSNCRRIGATCTSEPTAATAGFDPASLAILAKLQELESQISSLSGCLPEPREPDPTSIDAVTPGTPHVAQPDGHLQRGNLGQVLAWNVWQPYHPPRDLEAGGLVRSSESQSLASKMTDLDLSLFTGYLDAFFRNVHPLNPVLDEQQVRSQLTNLLLSGIGWDAASCLLLLVLANGACSCTFGELAGKGWRDEQQWASAQALFDAAEKRKATLRRGDYLTQARCHFYSGIFMMVSMYPFEAWQCFLQGLATCQRLTAPSRRSMPRDTAQGDKQAEESIYWSCWKSERELRFELDMPDFTATGYDHPVMFPTLPQASGQEELRAWYFYLAEISLWRFEMTARRSMADSVKYGPGTLESLAQSIVDLDTSLNSWQDSLPDAIRFGSIEEFHGNDVLLFVLRGRLTYNYEVLTWPFLETLILFGEHGSTRVREMASRGVRIHYSRLEINRPGLYYQHHGTWLMQCSSARSACVLLAVARSASAHLLPPDWLELVSDTVAMLEYWSERPGSEIVVFLKSVLSEFVESH